MKKLITLAAAVTIAIPLMASQAQSQISLVSYLGYNFTAGYDLQSASADDDDRVGAFLVGAGIDVGFPMDGPLGVSLRPTVEYMFLPGGSVQAFGDNVDFSQSRIQANINVVAQYGAPGAVAPYAGAGLAWSSYSVSAEACFNGNCESASESASGIGFNLLGGVELGTVGFGRPFIEGRYTILSISFDDIDFENESFNALTVTAGMIIPLGR